MTGRRLRMILAALLALGVATWAASGATFAVFSAQSSNSSSFSAAPDLVAPTINPGDAVVASTISGTPVRLPGWVHQGGTYKVFAEVSDTGNPPSGVSTVTANVTSIGAVGDTAVPLTFNSTGVTVNGVTYHWISSELTAANPLLASAQNKTFSVTATDGAGNSSGAVTSSNNVGVDNTAPANPSAFNVPNNIRGTFSFTATEAADATSGTSGVRFQYQPTAGGSFTTACIASGVSGALSCGFDTTTIADGTYNFQATGFDNAGNPSGGTASQTNKRVDNLAPTISAYALNPPSGNLTDTVDNQATATDGGSGLDRIDYEIRRTGTTGAWVLCTSGSSGQVKTCALNNTTRIPVDDANYDFRAVAYDNAANSSTNTITRFVDNRIFGTDIQANTGGDNLPSSGDSVTYSFSEPVGTGSILSGWTGASTAIAIRFVQNGSTDAVLIYDSTDTNQVAIGSINTQGNYVTGGTNNSSYVRFSGTMTRSGNDVVVTFTSAGTPVGSTVLAVGPAAKDLKWTPVATIQDTTGNTISSTSALTESGTSDADF